MRDHRHLSVPVAPCAAPPVTRTVSFPWANATTSGSRLTWSVTSRTVSEHHGLVYVRSFLSALVAFCQPPKRIAIFQRYPGFKMAGRVSAERQTLSSFLLRLTLSFPLAPSLPRAPYPRYFSLSFSLCFSLSIVWTHVRVYVYAYTHIPSSLSLSLSAPCF